MNPSTCSASFKKIHLFLQSLVEGYFLFLLFFTLSSILLTCLGFVVMLAYLGAAVNELICNQWERKGMHTDFHCSG
jgi:hypothetical protein